MWGCGIWLQQGERIRTPSESQEEGWIDVQGMKLCLADLCSVAPPES